MIHKKPLALVAALGFAASLACAPVLAQEKEKTEPGVEQPGQMPEQGQLDLGTIKFADLDVNNDGKISKDEFLKHGGSDQQFQQVDKNGDGVISQRELRDAKEQQKEEGGEMKQPQ